MVCGVTEGCTTVHLMKETDSAVYGVAVGGTTVYLVKQRQSVQCMVD